MLRRKPMLKVKERSCLNKLPDARSAPELAPPPVSATPFFARVFKWEQINDRELAIGLTLLCLLTRLPALPASLWEWDDMNFARAVTDYDLTKHNPHPPGFPVFIALARIAYAWFGNEHRALVAVNLFFAALLGAALFFFFREVFGDRRVALAGTILGSFLPNVWVYSGAGRSDGPAFTLGLIGLTLALRGLRSRRALLIGCALFGLALGVRVTILLVVGPTLALVLLAHLRQRQWRLVGVALALGGGGVLCWYAPLIWHTGWETYRWVMEQHAQSGVANDTLFSPTENSVVAYRWRRFFVDLWAAPWIMWTMYALALLGLLALLRWRLQRALGWLMLATIPFMIFAFIYNNPMGAFLYALPYMPLFIGLAACGLVLWPRVLLAGRAARLQNIGLFLAVGLAIGIAEWCYPMVKLLRREPNPAVQVLQHLRQTLDAQRDVLVYDGVFSSHVSFYLPHFKTVRQNGDYTIESGKADLINPTLATGRILSLTSEPVPGGDSQRWQWSSERGARRLRRLSLGRYFDAYLTDLIDPQRVIFAPSWGWYGEDAERSNWASPRAMVFLPPLAGAAQLQLTLRVPDQPDGTRSRIRLELANQVLDQFDPPPDWFVKTYSVPAAWHRGQFAQLTLVADRPYALPNGDERRIGLYARQIVWRPAQ